MYEDEAEKLVESTFGGAYNEKGFCNFINELLGGSGSFKPLDKTLNSEQIEPKIFQDKITSLKYLGKFIGNDKKEIDVLAVELKDFSTLERARSFQRNFIARQLEHSFKNAALVAFYTEENPEWRFSLVQVQYKREKGEIKKELTPSHRSSFLVGDTILKYTAKRQLNELLLSNESMSLDVLKKAFSIEPVTDKFFNEYIELYHKSLLPHIQESMKANSKFKNMDVDLIEIEAEKFTIHLLGQLIFLYFLQKKRLLGAPEGKHFDKGDIDFLYNLYKKGDFDNFYSEKLYYLLHDALAIERPSTNSYRKRLGGKIPYLNGGLFEAFDDNNWRKDLNISNDTFEKIFKFFDTYNFTVHEDEQLENEIAIDPEMLGKIFENLIPERKGKGAYYTHRNFVYYMCQESLIDYLHGYFKKYISHDDIEKFVIENAGDGEFKFPDSIKQFAQEIDKALHDVRICDPAIGSGAFPVAMMLEITRLRMALNKTIERDDPLNAYDCKLHCIEYCLYGVDTESLAVDIARLRFWLSLIIEEETSNTQEDRVVPLPNLDYKIIEYDALKRVDSEILFSPRLKELEKLKKTYFSKGDKEQKIKLKENIESEIAAILGKDCDMRFYFSEVFDKSARDNRPGFDIIIANPPYIQLQKNDGKLADDYKDYKYETFIRTGDIYVLFYERSIVDLLRVGGRLAFITSNKWMRANYGKNLRNFFINRTIPITLLDLGANAFTSATVDSNIIILSKQSEFANKPENLLDKKISASIIHEHEKNNLRDYILKSTIDMLLPKNDEQWLILSQVEYALLKKIESKGTPLKRWGEIFRGVTTGYNEAFIIDSKTRTRLIDEDPKSKELIKQVLQGRDIKKWHPDWQDKWLIATFPPLKIDIDSYPAIKNYLLEFGKNRLEQTGENEARKKTLHKWFESQDPTAYHEDFQKEKIIYPELNQSCSFVYDVDNYYLLNSAYIITSDSANLKNLTAFLNSTISQFWLFHNCSSIGNRGRRMIAIFLNELPVHEKINNCDELGAITEAITKGDDIQANEARLNQILYGLYDFTEDEKKLLDNTAQLITN